MRTLRCLFAEDVLQKDDVASPCAGDVRRRHTELRAPKALSHHFICSLRSTRTRMVPGLLEGTGTDGASGTTGTRPSQGQDATSLSPTCSQMLLLQESSQLVSHQLLGLCGRTDSSTKGPASLGFR